MRLQGSTAFAIIWPNDQLHRHLGHLSPGFAPLGLSSLLLERNLLHMEGIKTLMHETQISDNPRLNLLRPAWHLPLGCPLLVLLRTPCFPAPQQLLEGRPEPCYYFLSSDATCVPAEVKQLIKLPPFLALVQRGHVVVGRLRRS